MPYELRGNKVCKVGGGVVKDHGSDHAAAVKHLRALKANVEEGGMAGVLGALLEGAFDEARHPRGFHGRWVRGRGGKPGRLEGTYNGVKLERGVAYQGELAGGKVFTGHWTGEVQGFGRDAAAAQEPVFRHVDDPTMRRTFSGGKFYGRLKDVKPNPMSSSSRERGLASIEAGRRSDRPRVRPEDRAPNEQRSDEMASGPLQRPPARGSTGGGRGVMDAPDEKGWKRDASGRLVAPASEMHKNVAAKLTNLPVGGSHEIQDARATRTSSGYEVSGAGGEKKTHKSPSAAAGHMIRLHRRGLGVQESAPAPEVLGALLEGR